MAQSDIVASFLGALQAAISVELTLIYGLLAAYFGLLSEKSVKQLSKVCTHIFLPCLIITQTGPELDWTNLKQLWVLPAWAFVTITIAFCIGAVFRWMFRLPGWTVSATAINNANAMPLLLLQSLSSTGSLDKLAGWKKGESSSDAISRAKSYVLLYMIIQQAYGFFAGPYFLKLDRSNKTEESSNRDHRILQDSEHVGLLQDYDGEHEHNGHSIRDPSRPLQDLDDELDTSPDFSRFKWNPPRWLKKIGSVFNPPIIAAIIAVILGVTPPLHKAFLEKGSSPLYPSFTASLQNLADLFTAAQMFALGGQLYHKSPTLSSRRQAFKPSSMLRNLHMPPSLPVLFTRFVIMPAFCIGIVFLAARSHLSWLRDDPMLYFVLMICPSGPSALLMASLTQLVGVDEGEVAWFLVVSYIISPLMAIIVTIAVQVITSVSS